MKIKGKASDLYACVIATARQVSADIKADEPMLKQLYDLRLKDDVSKAKWDAANRAAENAKSVLRQILAMSRQLKAAGDNSACLSSYEAGFLAYVKDPDSGM